MKPTNYVHGIIISILCFLVTSNGFSQDYKNSFKLNFTPTGGYRILTDDSATNLLPGFRNYETIRFGMGGTFEYQRIVKNWFYFSVGLEYQYFEYGGEQPFNSYDSINNFTSAGTLKTSYIHHYLGVPIKLQFNLVSKEKFRLYTFLGVTPKFAIVRLYDTEFRDTVNNFTSTFHSQDPEDAGNGYQRNVFNVEGLAGIGINFHLSKRMYIDLNGFFGMHMLKSNKNTPINEYIYRFGGNVGFGYLF